MMILIDIQSIILKKFKMKKDNFFNFKQNNIWDIGFPISPRKFIIIMFILIPIIIGLTI